MQCGDLEENRGQERNDGSCDRLILRAGFPVTPAPPPGAAVPRTCWMCPPVSGNAPPGAELLGKKEPVKIQVGLEQEKVCVWNTAESGVV